MIRSRQTAFISACVLMGGLVFGWAFTLWAPSPSLSSAQTTESSVQLPAVTPASAPAPSVSLHAHVPVYPQRTEAPVTAVSVPIVPRASHSLSSPLSGESFTSAAPGTAKSGSTAAASRMADKVVTITATGYAPLPLPALSVEADAVSLTTIPISAVLAAGHTAVPLDPVQKAGLETIADNFAEKAGEPPVGSSEGERSAFAVNAYIAATEADFLIKQRYGHRAYVQMQLEAARALYSR